MKIIFLSQHRDDILAYAESKDSLDDVLESIQSKVYFAIEMTRNFNFASI